VGWDCLALAVALVQLVSVSIAITIVIGASERLSMELLMEIFSSIA
jgi:hypothetical protein